jgi:hypothetical protein
MAGPDYWLPSEASRCPRQVIHLSMLKNHLQPMDIILFRCAHTLSGIQRMATSAEWDHGEALRGLSAWLILAHFLAPVRTMAVALVVEEPGGKGLGLLEATGDGVTCYPVVARLRAYSNEFTGRTAAELIEDDMGTECPGDDENLPAVAEYMALRKLQAERTPVMLQRLRDFVEQVNGKSYGFPFSKLFPRKHRRGSGSSLGSIFLGGDDASRAKPASPPPRLPGEKKAFFCSASHSSWRSHASLREPGEVLTQCMWAQCRSWWHVALPTRV